MHDSKWDSNWSLRSAFLGGVAWLFAPLLPATASPAFGSLEHVFLFFPLVAAPLAIALLIILLREAGRSIHVLHRFAQRAQPVAAAMMLASFALPKGTMAGVLAAAWLIMALAISIAGARTASPRANLNLFAAHFLLLGGAVWLLLSRAGVTPGRFTELRVFLAAVHFHFNGFTLQILIAATGMELENARPTLRRVHRALAIGSLAAIPLIFFGTVFASPGVKVIGVASIVLSTIALAIVSGCVALKLELSKTKLLLLASSASILLAMIVAGVFGAGELAGREWISIQEMVTTHGFLNAFGFVLCGLFAHLGVRIHSRNARGASMRSHVGPHEEPVSFLGS